MVAQGVDHCVGNILFMNRVTNKQHAGKCSYKAAEANPTLANSPCDES